MNASTALLNTPEKPNAEIACNFIGAPDTPDERLAEYGRLFQHALAGRQRTADAVEFTFAAKAGVAEWVADLARREAACCPFMAHHVSSDGSPAKSNRNVNDRGHSDASSLYSDSSPLPKSAHSASQMTSGAASIAKAFSMLIAF